MLADIKSHMDMQNEALLQVAGLINVNVLTYLSCSHHVTSLKENYVYQLYIPLKKGLHLRNSNNKQVNRNKEKPLSLVVLSSSEQISTNTRIILHSMTYQVFNLYFFGNFLRIH